MYCPSCLTPTIPSDTKSTPIHQTPKQPATQCHAPAHTGSVVAQAHGTHARLLLLCWQLHELKHRLVSNVILDRLCVLARRKHGKNDVKSNQHALLPVLRHQAGEVTQQQQGQHTKQAASLPLAVAEPLLERNTCQRCKQGTHQPHRPPVLSNKKCSRRVLCEHEVHCAQRACQPQRLQCPLQGCDVYVDELQARTQPCSADQAKWVQRARHCIACFTGW
mmetsp:Transcript_35301/g.89355  ORF Transcript_35301/g.89355 Transcript_35301/m.89355 type:complete len:220 (-) Transcript_35301:282-941(-)